MSSTRFTIDVPIRGDWSNIDLLTTSVRACFAAMMMDVEGCQTVAIVASELLENAVKYGDWSGSDRTFRFHVSGEGGRASISVENPVSDPERALGEIEETLRWIATFPSAASAFQARLVEVASAPAGGSSRLGLARIAHQAKCTLRAERVGHAVRVVADVSLSQLPDGGASPSSVTAL
jgi:hypothetical protein